MTLSLFIAGTDTGVGKTFIGCLLAEGVREMGLRVGVLKPFSAGDLRDAAALHRAAGGHGSARQATLRYSPLPLSPAAQVGLGKGGQEKAEETIARSVRVVRDLQKKKDCVLVEGVGGVMAPLGGRLYVVDLMARLALPVWVVGRAGLGTLNHTILTVETIRRQGLVPGRIILNGFTGKDLSERSNGRILKRLLGIPVTVVPRASSPMDKIEIRRLLLASFRDDFFDEK